MPLREESYVWSVKKRDSRIILPLHHYFIVSATMRSIFSVQNCKSARVMV